MSERLTRQGRQVEKLRAELHGEGMTIHTDWLWRLPGNPVRVVAHFPDRPEPFVALIDKKGRRL